MAKKDTLPKGWLKKPLIDITTLITDGSHFSPKTIEKGYPYITVRDIDKFGEINFIDCKKISKLDYEKLVASKCQPLTGDILFSKDGTVGKVALVNCEKEFVVLSSLAIIRPNTNLISSNFMCWMFKSPNIQNEAIGLKTGAAIKRVVLKTIKKLEFPLPPLPEQQRIVNKLDALFARIDEAIQLVEANLELIPSLKMALLEKAFKGQLLSEVALGENGLPLGWELTTIGKAAIIRPKKSEVKEIDNETPISFVPMAFLNENNIQFNHQTEKPLKEVYKGYTYFRNGDVLLAKVTPCFENGKAGIAKDLTNGIGFGSSEFHIVRPKEGILAEWIYYTFLTNKFKAEGKRSFTGSSGLKRVPHAFIQKYKIPLPPIKEQIKIIDTLDQLFNNLRLLKTENQNKLKHLQDLKKSLLEQAFQGKL